MRARTLLAALCGAAALAFPAAAGASVASNLRIAIDSAATFPNVSQTAQREQYVILQVWQTSLAQSLKAANPNMKVLAYENLSSMASGTRVNGMISSGVGYDEADFAHPDWFLLNTSGQRISEGGYGWLYMADIGNAGYQQQWAANVIHNLQSGPWDGVFMDEANTTAKYDTNPSSIAKYPTDGSYEGAMRSMLAYVGPKLHAAGYLAMPNMGAWVEHPTVVQDWLQFVDGGMDEMFDKWSTTVGQGYRDAGQWKTQLDELTTTESMGKTFLAVTQAAATDTQAQRFGWGSALLGANGHASYTAAPDYTTEVWNPDFGVDVGTPTEGAKGLSNGAYMRHFTNGVVVVNPTTGTTHVDFGGTYSGDGLVNAAGADLPAHTALILTGPPSSTGSTGDSGTTTTSGSGTTTTTSGSGTTTTTSGSGTTTTTSGSGTTTTSGGKTHKKPPHAQASSFRVARTSRLRVRVAAVNCPARATVVVALDGRIVLIRLVEHKHRAWRKLMKVRRGRHRLTVAVRSAASPCAGALSVRHLK